jgi:hypothetical protein
MADPGDLPQWIEQLPDGWLKTILEINYWKPRASLGQEFDGQVLTGRPGGSWSPALSTPAMSLGI